MLSVDGDGLGIAQKLKEEGNDVDLFIKNPNMPFAGKGIVQRINSWRPHIARAELVICDMVGFGKYEDTFRKLGKVFIGCNKFADMIELDREKGIEVFNKFNINVPETYFFDSPEEARGIADIWEESGFVVKPSGNLDTAKTFICRHPDIFRWCLSTLPSGTKLIVQKIVDGIEISTEGWFNGRDWIRPFNHTFEEKKFMQGDKGPNTGCMGNLVIGTEGNRLTRETIEKISPLLKKIGYRGPVDINCIVDANELYALEFTPRFGYDAIEALMEGLQEPVTDLMFETAAGMKKDMMLSEDYLIAVRASVPPYPHAEAEGEKRGMPIIGLNAESMKHIYLTDAYLDDGEYKYAGSDGVVLKATAHGRDISEARNRVYRTLNNLVIQDMQFRQDIGSRVSNDIRMLKEWGWL